MINKTYPLRPYYKKKKNKNLWMYLQSRSYNLENKVNA